MTGLEWECRIDLPGWDLFWAHLQVIPEAPSKFADQLLSEVESDFRRRYSLETLTANPVIGKLRELFKAAGTSPSRYRPSSEALARRVLKGDPLPRITPLVDFNNALSLETLCPCCVMRTGSVQPPVVLRRGGAGEILTGLQGPFELEGKPVLVDVTGPFGTPITDDHRVILNPSDRFALLVMYLPAAGDEQAEDRLADLARRSGGIEITASRRISGRV